MDTAMDAELIPSDRICSTCRTNLIPSHLVFKNCTICRGKNRVKEARRAERRRERNKYIAAHEKILMDSSISDDDNGSHHPTRENAISSGSRTSTSLVVGTLKPNTQPKLLHELGGKEREHAIKMIKASLQTKIRDNGGIKLVVEQLANVPGNAREFQTASLLYEKLKSKVLRSSAAGKRLRFHGYHSIVAVSTTNHEDRVATVSNHLRKIARISFAHRSVVETTTDNSMYSRVYDCRCLRAASSNLAGPSNQAHALKPVIECNGSVRVTAEFDGSHSHRLEGQKISVSIFH